jgi:outer membrane protein assembly factor BamB
VAADLLRIGSNIYAVTLQDELPKAFRWRESTEGPWSSSRPYLLDHAVIAGNERGEVFAFRVSDGSRLWSQKFDGVFRGIGFSEGTLYVGTLKGKVFAWRAGSPPRD